MNSKNNKAIKPHRFKLDLAGKFILKDLKIKQL